MNKVRRKSRKIEISESHLSAKTLIGLALILVGVIALLFFVYQRGAKLNPSEYEGKIIEKWAGYAHSEQGSTPYFRLLLEAADGHRSTVAVDKDTYNRANVGMWIKKSRKGIELSFAILSSSSLTVRLSQSQRV